MTIEELEAYAWCLARNYPSQSARRARILANYIKRTNPPPNADFRRGDLKASNNPQSESPSPARTGSE